MRLNSCDAGYRFTRCNMNYASHCLVSRHVCQVTLLVIDSLCPFPSLQHKHL